MIRGGSVLGDGRRGWSGLDRNRDIVDFPVSRFHIPAYVQGRETSDQTKGQEHSTERGNDTDLVTGDKLHHGRSPRDPRLSDSSVAGAHIRAL